MPSDKLIKTLYAAAGAGDMAVAKLRAIPAEYRRLTERAADIAAVRSAVEDYTTKATGRAAEIYDGLAGRGERLVSGIRRQRATSEFTGQVESTRRQFKATATTARKSVAQTRSRAKGVSTSARKTATAAARAVEDAADKIG